MEKKTIKVALRENKTATADKAPYLMAVIPNGTAGIEDLVASMREDGFNVLKPGADFSMSGRGFPTDGTEVGAVTLRDGAGEVHVVEIVSARRECLNCRAPHTAATGDGLLEITLLGGKKGDCRFAASRKVKIV